MNFLLAQDSFLKAAARSIYFEEYLHTFRYGQGRAPLVSQDVKTYATIGVDIWVVDAGDEIYFRRLERVVGLEMDVEEENTSRIRTVTLQKSFSFEPSKIMALHPSESVSCSYKDNA